MAVRTWTSPSEIRLIGIAVVVSESLKEQVKMVSSFVSSKFPFQPTRVVV